MRVVYRDGLAQQRQKLRIRIEEAHERAKRIERNVPSTSPCPPFEVEIPRLIGDGIESLDERGLRQATKQVDAWSRELGRAEGFNKLLQAQARALAAGEDLRVLHPKPRLVPLTYALAEMAPSWMIFFAVALQSIILFGFGPRSAFGAVGFSAGIIVLLLSGVRRGRRRVQFLATCEQAVGATKRQNKRYASRTKYRNWPVRQSKGWSVSTAPYSGTGNYDEVRAETLAGDSVSLVVEDAGYTGGVVLYSPTGDEAYDVKQLASAPKPTRKGDAWQGGMQNDVLFRLGGALVAIMAVGYALVTVPF